VMVSMAIFLNSYNTIQTTDRMLPLQKHTVVKLFGTKYQVKYGNASGKTNSFIVSRKAKRKTTALGGELSEEDKKDLALLGSSGEGARLVDSRESTYDSQRG